MDNRTPEQRRKNMQNIKPKNTKPEKALMKALRGRNIWFTKHRVDVFGKPDIVFKRKRIAVFVDSEFWHGRKHLPKSNVEFWKKRFERNRKRDEEVNAELKKQGWTVIRISDAEIKSDIAACINRVTEAYSNTN
jgi:DNA mismatch endonuclease Vsr